MNITTESEQNTMATEARLPKAKRPWLNKMAA
jgi:hypothetical protein